MDDRRLRAWLGVTLSEYAQRFPSESGAARVSVAPATQGELDIRDRSRAPFHVTASAIVVRDGKVLLVKHKALGRWLQPGGHILPGETPWQAARREAEEETGLGGIRPMDGIDEQRPLDIDLHDIPANPAKGEPAHMHLDLRFLLAAPSSWHAEIEPSTINADVFAWLPLQTAARSPGATVIDAALERALAKAVQAVSRRNKVKP
jgi:8-oxo-dGTP pyrophosphatase MutT (NUDIX family)